MNKQNNDKNFLKTESNAADVWDSLNTANVINNLQKSTTVLLEENARKFYNNDKYVVEEMNQQPSYCRNFWGWYK